MSLKPLPKSKQGFIMEATKLGLLQPNAVVDTPRKRLLSHVYESQQIGRCQFQGSILLVGTSGVGKSSTLNHLFNIGRGTKESGVNFAKTSDSKSETRNTTEFVITANAPRFEVGGLMMGLVDSPGFNDTDGTQQDACNFYSIKKFYQEHPIMAGCYPNLIFLVVNANDNRIEGPNSNLTKSLKCLKKLNLVDQTHPNVIGIMSHADIARKPDKWRSLISEKKNRFKDAIFKYLQVSADVVAIENDLEDLDHVNEWTKLPDGTLQPLNLFKACIKLFKENGDTFGHLLFNACFENASNPTKGFEVQANSATKKKLNSEEKKFHDFYVKTTQGGMDDPLVMEADTFIKEQNLNDDDGHSIQDLASRIRGLGVHDKEDLKYTSFDALKFLIRMELTDDHTNFLLKLGVKQTPPVDVDTMVRILGQGYNILHDKTVPSEIFKYKTRNTNCGILVPMPAGFSKVNDTINHMDFFQSEKEMIQSRMKYLNVSVDVDYSSFSLGARAGYNTAGSISTSTSSMEYSFLMEQRMFELRMANFDEMELTPDFIKDIRQLPSQYNNKDQQNRGDFRAFFERWGHFVVTQAYGGGSIEMKINTMACSSAGISQQDLKAELMACFNAESRMSVRGSVDGGSTGSSSIDTKRILSQSAIHWIGGNRELQTHATIEDHELMSKWRMSLMTQPMMLDHELCLTPISLIVEKVDGTKNIACRRALEGLLGGKFQVQTNLERKREEKAREEEEEKERVEAETRTEAANDQNNQPVSSGKKCFPGSAEITVVEEGREKKMQMRDLKIGRSVKTFDPITGACTFSPVVAFIHRDPDKPARFHKLTLDTGNSITLSGNHLLMTGEAEGSKTAAEIKIGDILLIETGAVGKVVETRRVLEVGIYCPLTRKGTLCVNGVLASCYASVGDRRVGLFNITVSGHQIAHMALTPLRMWKRIVPAKGTAIIPVFDPYVNWLKKTRMAAFFAGPIN